MIKKIWHKEYAVVCNKCGEETLLNDDANEAIKEAKSAGWLIINRCFDQPFTLCSKCRQREKAIADDAMDRMYEMSGN